MSCWVLGREAGRRQRRASLLKAICRPTWLAVLPKSGVRRRMLSVEPPPACPWLALLSFPQTKLPSRPLPSLSQRSTTRSRRQPLPCPRRPRLLLLLSTTPAFPSPPILPPMYSMGSPRSTPIRKLSSQEQAVDSFVVLSSSRLSSPFLFDLSLRICQLTFLFPPLTR
jgi:hypothetical protein